MKKLYRNQTKEIRIGDVVIGGDHPVAIQSMTNTRTEDVKGTVEQIRRLEKAGCEIIRCTVPTREIFILITGLQSQPLRTEPTRSGSILEISVQKNGLRL